MENTKQYRVLEIFFRGLRGEDLSVQELANEYNVSSKSITRSINELKDFLADHRELVGNTELQYSYSDKCYRLFMDEFLSNKELFSLVEVKWKPNNRSVPSLYCEWCRAAGIASSCKAPS